MVTLPPSSHYFRHLALCTESVTMAHGTKEQAVKTMDRALLCAAGARHDPHAARRALRRVEAAIVPARERADQAPARPPKAVRQPPRLHAGADFAVGPVPGYRRQPHRIKRRAARGRP